MPSQNTKDRRQNTKLHSFSFLACFLIFLLFCGLFADSVFAAGQGLSSANASSGQRTLPEEIWDADKYISLDEITAGMRGYCLSCFKGTEIEKSEVEVISVVRKISPGRDAILVQCLGEPYIRTGPVAGCSGSPVYINGKMAGALAFAWPYSKDAVFGVTPIGEMLEVSHPDATPSQPGPRGYAFDFSRPINFNEIEQEIRRTFLSHNPVNGRDNRLPGLLVGSGLSPAVCRRLNEMVEPFGLVLAAGGSGDTETVEEVTLQPGSCIGVPWVTGDISLAWFGTVTEVAGENVFSFGHGLIGNGPVDLPMATGQVHTVISNLSQSFKLASVGKVVGALQQDTSVATVGRIGRSARMIPLSIRIDRYDDTGVRTYNCRLATHRMLTQAALQLAVLGAAFYVGELPLDHTIDYEVNIALQGRDSISFKNISSGKNLNEMIMEAIASVALLMNNPFEQVDIKSIDFDIRITPTNNISGIWSVELSDSKVQAGQEIEVSVVLQSYLAEKKKYRFDVKVPEQLKPGQYTLTLCGSNFYEQFLQKTVPHRFIVRNVPTLIDALNDALNIKRDEMYCLFVLPSSGISVERAELADLPATKALVLQDAGRTISVKPYPKWIEKTLQTGTVVLGSRSLRITVEE